MYHDLRRESAERLVEMDFDGYAIGGLSVGEPRELTLEVIREVLPLLPKDKPRYVMGVGYPDEIEQYARMGVDMMDCVLPTRAARHGLLFTSQGRVNIKNKQYAEDQGPADPACRLHGVPALLARIPPPPDAMRRAAGGNAEHDSQSCVLPRHHGARARRARTCDCRCRYTASGLTPSDIREGRRTAISDIASVMAALAQRISRRPWPHCPASVRAAPERPCPQPTNTMAEPVT